MHMNENTREELKFFGKVSATVSHDIKNVFAVINEGAGLLEDLALMAGKGIELTPERLLKAVQSIKGQIRKGDEIVRNMNAFSHSVDEDVREINLAETVRLVVALSQRPAAMKQAALVVGDLEATPVKTDPYMLEHFLHAVILTALEDATSGTELKLSVSPKENGGAILLEGAPSSAELASNTIEQLSRPLGIRVMTEEATGSSTLLLPMSIPASAETK